MLTYVQVCVHVRMCVYMHMCMCAHVCRSQGPALGVFLYGSPPCSTDVYVHHEEVRGQLSGVVFFSCLLVGSENQTQVIGSLCKDFHLLSPPLGSLVEPGTH